MWQKLGNVRACPGKATDSENILEDFKYTP